MKPLIGKFVGSALFLPIMDTNQNFRVVRALHQCPGLLKDTICPPEPSASTESSIAIDGPRCDAQHTAARPQARSLDFFKLRHYLRAGPLPPFSPHAAPGGTVGHENRPGMHQPLPARHADAGLDQGQGFPCPAGKPPTVPTLRLAPRPRSVRTAKFAQDGDLIKIVWLALKAPHLAHPVPRRCLRPRRISLSD